MPQEDLEYFAQPQEEPVAESREEAQKELEKAFNKLEKELENKESTQKLVDKLLVNEDSTEKDLNYRKYADDLALYVQSCFETSRNARRNIEYDWLKALKQYKGVYSPEFLAKIVPNRSRAFVRVTRTKVKTVDSRLSDLLFPANGDKNWEIYPTPLPELSDAKKQAIISMYEEETKEQITPEKLDVLIQQEATRQAKKMSKVISDQLSEIKYREIMRDVIHSGNVYGTGILKGPLVSIAEDHQYYKQIGEDNKERWVLKDYDRMIPFIENIRIWDVYPDMEATTFDECRFIIQRRKMNKFDLIKLSKREDFAGSIIKQFLADFPEGNYDKEAFEVELQTLGDIITVSNGGDNRARKYEVLEYWGYVDHKTLEDFGVVIPKEKEGMLDVPANIWVLGNKVIKAALAPLDGVKWPFYVYYYDKDETSVFGEGIPSIMSTMQEMTNSAFRAMLDNAAISAGPQLEINLDLLSEDEDPREVHPFKVWLRTGTGLEASNPCIRAIDMKSYTPEFERMLNLFAQYSDEITTIPRYMWGDNSQNVGRTSSGLSMLMGSANMAIKDQVKNFDDGITTPFIQAMYHWNMQFGTDEDVKGDYTVVAKGSASLIAKEMYTQYLIQFLNITNNQMDATMVKRPNIIRSIADAFDLNSDSFVLSDAEIQAQQQQQQQQQQEQQEFMYNIIEAARENGISPESLVASMRQLQQEQQRNLQAEAQMMQQQQGTLQNQLKMMQQRQQQQGQFR